MEHLPKGLQKQSYSFPPSTCICFLSLFPWRHFLLCFLSVPSFQQNPCLLLLQSLHSSQPFISVLLHHLLLSIFMPLEEYPTTTRQRERAIENCCIWNFAQEGGLVSGPRQWGRGAFDEDDRDDETDDEDDEDWSLDLLVRFIQNVFRKISRRARKAVRSVLPIAMSTRLISMDVTEN